LHLRPRTKLVRENRAMPVTYHLPHTIIVFVLLVDHSLILFLYLLNTNKIQQV